MSLNYTADDNVPINATYDVSSGVVNMKNEDPNTLNMSSHGQIKQAQIAKG